MRLKAKDNQTTTYMAVVQRDEEGKEIVELFPLRSDFNKGEWSRIAQDTPRYLRHFFVKAKDYKEAKKLCEDHFNNSLEAFI